MGAELFHADRRTGGQTDMTKLIVAIRNLRAPLKSPFIFNHFSENRTVYEIMWKNMAESDGPQMTI